MRALAGGPIKPFTKIFDFTCVGQLYFGGSTVERRFLAQRREFSRVCVEFQ